MLGARSSLGWGLFAPNGMGVGETQNLTVCEKESISVEMIALGLVPAKQNVRVVKVSRDSQAALMASFAAEGVLQNLVVVSQGEKFAVIAWDHSVLSTVHGSEALEQKVHPLPSGTTWWGRPPRRSKGSTP